MVPTLRSELTGLLQVRVQADGHAASISVTGELDYATARILAAGLAEALAHQPERLILDMAQVTFIDCSGLGVILHAHNRLPATARLIFRSPSRPVRRLLEMAGLDKVWEWQET